MDITFEKALAADAETMLKIQIRAFHQDTVDYGVEEGGPPEYDSLERMLSDIRDYETYKIVSDEKILGGIVVWDEAEGHYHLDKIYIDPDYHNQGIGTKAITFIEATFPAQKWTLDTPKYAVRNQHFYEKFGFVKVGESEEEPDGLILFAYEKQIG
jgi:ribosomal protein S18 acetylase RimI-like enzyme